MLAAAMLEADMSVAGPELLVLRRWHVSCWHVGRWHIASMSWLLAHGLPSAHGVRAK
jgi:hypothetical protein